MNARRLAWGVQQPDRTPLPRRLPRLQCPRTVLGAEGGLSMIELLVAATISALVVAALFRVMTPVEARVSTGPELADMQQRLRVAHDGLSRDLTMAGAGAYLGSRLAVGPLNRYVAPILPYRVGAVNGDGPGTFKTDTITIMYVPSTPAQASLGDALAPGAAQLRLAGDCSSRSNVCGFTTGQTILVFDATGSRGLFTIVSAIDGSYSLQVDRLSGAATTLAAGSTVAEVVQRTYSLKADQRTGIYQLMRYDGSSNADAPVVDHLVGLVFEYYADPEPPRLVGPPGAPRTTYGPLPPDGGVQATAYPAGENCTFQVDPASGEQIPRLGVLGEPPVSGSLVKLAAPQLGDGPWCPDALAPDRWDADLLRIRMIGVTLRVEAAIAALRGPAGVLFTRSGTSVDGNRWAPDQEIRFHVTPRNLNLHERRF